MILCKIEIALNMHKFKNDKLLDTFQNYFTLRSNVHHYSTRSKLQLTFMSQNSVCLGFKNRLNIEV